MSIDNPHAHSEVAAEIVEQSEQTAQEIILRSGLAGVLSAIPLVGSAINEMLTELAVKRVYERMQAMMEEMGKRIEELGEEKINREWFRSEQFQTLLYEAMSQLHTTHDRDKLTMLGNALANSGSCELTEDDRKELFVRLLRDLAPQHIATLVSLLPPADRQIPVLPSSASPEDRAHFETYMKAQRWNSRPVIVPSDVDLLIAQMLSGFGLLEEELRSGFKQPNIHVTSQHDAERALAEILRELQKPPKRQFRISELGKDFLSFVGLPKEETAQETPNQTA